MLECRKKRPIFNLKSEEKISFKILCPWDFINLIDRNVERRENFSGEWISKLSRTYRKKDRFDNATTYVILYETQTSKLIFCLSRLLNKVKISKIILTSDHEKRNFLSLMQKPSPGPPPPPPTVGYFIKCSEKIDFQSLVYGWNK